MIFDFHTHLALKKADYLDCLKKSGVNKAVVIPFSFAGYNIFNVYKLSLKKQKPKEYIDNVLKKLVDINSEFLDKTNYINKEERRVYPAPWISPECEGIEEVINDDRVKIIKFIPVMDNVTSDYYKRIEPLVKEAVGLNKIVMVHTGWGAPVKPVADLAKSNSKGTFVIAHAKEDDDTYKEARVKALNLDNVYLELSFIPHAKRVSQYVKLGFVDKLLFGSDLITESDVQSVKGYISVINCAEITGSDKRKIFYKNAEKLFNNC